MVSKYIHTTVAGSLAFLLVACGGKTTQDSDAPTERASRDGGASDEVDDGFSGGVESGGSDSGGSDSAGGFSAGGDSAAWAGAGSSAGGDGSLGGQGPWGATAGAGGTGVGSGGASGGSSEPEFCMWNWYDTDLTDEVLTCEHWTRCDPGTYQAEQGGYTRDSVCLPCESGTFSEDIDVRRCEPWHRCELGEQVATEPNAVNDRSCNASEAFAPRPGEAAALAVIEQNAHLLVWGPYGTPVPGTVVANYSASGELLGDWVVGTGESEQISTLVDGGSSLFVVGVRPSGLSQPAFVRKLGANGTVAWELPIVGSEDSVSEMGVAADAEHVYIVGRVYEGEESRPKLVLFVVDAAGDSVLTHVLEDNTDVTAMSVAVASGGHIFVGCQRSSANSNNGGSFILEFDAEGTPVVEHAFDGVWVQRVTDDKAGGVYALVTAPQLAGQHFLYRFGPQGQLLLSQELLSDRNFELTQLTASADNVILLGTSADSPVLLRTDPMGSVLSVDTLEDFANPTAFSAVRQAVDGTVFVAGSVGNKAFVAQWPR